MPVSGLVITFAGPVEEYPESVRSLRHRANVEIGESSGPKLAIVVDSATAEKDQETWGWIRRLPGVEMVDVAFVGLD